MIDKKTQAKALDYSKSFDDLGIKAWNDEKNYERDFDVISTGSRNLNRCLNIGGWPAGRIVEIFGTDSSGKSTLALQTIAQAQKEKKVCVYIDLENTLNKEWAITIGVDIQKLYICSPKNGEDAFKAIHLLADEGAVDLVIVDSVAALVPSVEIENDFGDQTMGIHARLMSKGLRILQSNLIGKKTTFLFINQIREKIGNSYLPTTTTTGGRALRYAASLRVEIKKCESIRHQEKIIGFVAKAVIVKNKFGPPMVNALLTFTFECGFDYFQELISDCVNKKIIEKKGSWFSYKDKNLAQGVISLKQKLINEKELFLELEKASA